MLPSHWADGLAVWRADVAAGPVRQQSLTSQTETVWLWDRSYFVQPSLFPHACRVVQLYPLLYATTLVLLAYTK